jgi:hypothetical protein
MKLVRALRADRLLLALTVVLVLAAWAPLLASPLLPFSDLHNNAAAASMLVDAARGAGTVGWFYHVKWAPLPYWTGYLIMAAASAVGGVFFAAKAIVAVLAVALPLSVMRLLLALGRSPRLGLWAFALFWDHNLYSGWVTFLVGMALAFFALAALVEIETRRDTLPALLWTALCALTHLQALAVLAVAGIGIAVAGRPGRRRLLLCALALAGGALPALPWVGAHLASGDHATGQPWLLEMDPFVVKVGQLFAFTLDHYPAKPRVWAPAFAFAVASIGPILLAAARPRRSAGGHGRAAAIVAFSCLALYVGLPLDIRGPASQVHVYPRYATFVLATLLLLPRPDLRGWRAILLAPGVLAALAMDVTTYRQLQHFGDNARPFLDLVPEVPRGSRLLPLINTETDPASAYHPYNQFHAYLAAATKSYDPYLFHNDGHPFQYTAEHEPAVPRWSAATRQLVMEEHAGSFDFILVQGLQIDPFRPGGRLSKASVRLVAERRIWRLYAIER